MITAPNASLLTPLAVDANYAMETEEKTVHSTILANSKFAGSVDCRHFENIPLNPEHPVNCKLDTSANRKSAKPTKV